MPSIRVQFSTAHGDQGITGDMWKGKVGDVELAIYQRRRELVTTWLKQQGYQISTINNPYTLFTSSSYVAIKMVATEAEKRAEQRSLEQYIEQTKTDPEVMNLAQAVNIAATPC